MSLPPSSIATPPARVPVSTDDQIIANATTVGQLMETPGVVLGPECTVARAIETVRETVKSRFVTYVYVVDEPTGRLIGVVAMRELVLAAPGQKLSEVMLENPFALQPGMKLLDAMRRVVHRHFPSYPVCDAAGVLVGIVWGQKLFAAEAIEISAQSGKMVGVDKEERFSTPLRTSFFFRHPWLQVNLVTTFAAAAVVGFYEGTINKFVALAVFLPVMMSQTGNTGCQSLAVTLRGLTLGDIAKGKARELLRRETWLGLFNGLFTGISAGLGMLVYALVKGEHAALQLSLATFVAMTLCCTIASQFGALTPLILKRFGADPATASAIFLTTITDTISMGVFLWLATVLLM